MEKGRFAPSPSGRMHLGNLISALLAWLDVRSIGGTMLLRMEDLDPDRCKPEYTVDTEFGLGYGINDVVLIVLWGVASFNDPAYLPMVAWFIMFLANDVYGFLNWRRMRRRQQGFVK